jgi:hypothetical protein
MIDANRERMRKEKANYDVSYQSTTKYQQESKSTKQWVVPKELIEQYMACTDKTSFLQQYGNEVSI